jgi:hypothetical protein
MHGTDRMELSLLFGIGQPEKCPTGQSLLNIGKLLIAIQCTHSGGIVCLLLIH